MVLSERCTLREHDFATVPNGPALIVKKWSTQAGTTGTKRGEHFSFGRCFGHRLVGFGRRRRMVVALPQSRSIAVAVASMEMVELAMLSARGSRTGSSAGLRKLSTRCRHAQGADHTCSLAAHIRLAVWREFSRHDHLQAQRPKEEAVHIDDRNRCTSHTNTHDWERWLLSCTLASLCAPYRLASNLSTDPTKRVNHGGPLEVGCRCQRSHAQKTHQLVLIEESVNHVQLLTATSAEDCEGCMVVA